MSYFDEGPSTYGMQTIGNFGRSNAGQRGGYDASRQFGGGSGMTGTPSAGMSPQMIEERRRQLLLRQQQQNAQQGDVEERRVQQEIQNAKPVQNYVDTWQMTPEKVAAYRAAKEGGGTAMGQQQQGISNGQMSGQQAIANLLRMMGLM